MTEPLLTIDEATRRYRVSAKTIRRRLQAGEFPAAYKRPGDRGPEWVIPLSALESAAFVPRADDAVPVAVVPADDGDRASYWQERALAAETALAARPAVEPPAVSPSPPPTSAPSPSSPPSTPARDDTSTPERMPDRPKSGSTGTPFRARWWLGAAVVLLIALVAALLFSDRDTDPPSVAAPDALTVVLSEIVPVDEVLGVNDPDASYLPPGREVVALSSIPESTPLPRYVLWSGARSGAVAARIPADAPVLLRLQRDGTPLVLLDTQGARPDPVRPVEVEDAESDTAPATTAAPSEDGSTSADDAVPGVPTSEDGPTSPDEVVPPTPPDDAAVDAPVVAATTTVVVGDSFWKIAEREAGDGASLQEVTTYWAALVAANADNLVEPGNPDLIFAGQVLVLPAFP